MDPITLISLILALAKSVLPSFKATAGLPSNLVTDLQAAIDALQKVHGTAVTFEQAEALRTKPTW